MSRLKEIRREKGYTLNNVSEATGYTKSFLSQLERGLKKPSLDSLRKIADFLDVPITMLLEEESVAIPSEDGCVVLPPEMHIRMQLSGKSPVLYEMLTPNVDGRGLKGYVCHIEPGGSSSGQQVSHKHAECSYVLTGVMSALVRETVFQVAAGSSIYIEPYALHNFLNRTDKPLTLIGFYYV